MDPYENTNIIEYCFKTNNDNPIKVQHDERRFTCFERSSAYANIKIFHKFI